MNLSAKRVLPLAISALTIALLGASNVPNLPLPANGAMIYNPGTGDFSGFRIVVTPDGRAISIDGAGHASTQLQSDVVTKFFDDLASAGVLSQLSAKPCNADINAPTTVEVNAAITISWKGQHSPALTCATDPTAQRLLLDATQIQHSLYVQAYRRRNLIAYGTAYASSSRASGYNGVGYGGLSFDRFYAGGFSNTPFFIDPFSMEHFSNGISAANPFTSSPFSGAPYASLPYTSLPNSAAFTSLPSANPFTGSPYSGSPFSGNPFSSPGFSSGPYSSSGSYTTNVP